MIGEALAAACGDRAVLARLGGPLGEAARAAHDRLARTAGPDARRALRAGWAAAARAPVPPGIRGVHPSWIEAALAELPARARADLARGGLGAGAGDGAGETRTGAGETGEADRVAVWLTRWACAGLPPLPAAAAAGSGPPASLSDAVRLRGDDLAAWLADVGADQLALAIGAAGAAAGEALAAAARIVGDRLPRAAARMASPPRAGGRGPARAAGLRCRLSRDDRALLVIGARSLAPHTDALSRRQLAVRLPRPLGLAILAALEAFARSPVEQAPSWRALSARF